MTRFLTATLSMALLSVRLLALDVDSEAGKLSTLIADPSGVTELRINGSIDASDFLFIDQQMPALRTLDLSAAHIAAYSGKALRGISTSAENTIPQGAFAASAITAVNLPTSGTVRIGDLAFAGSALKSIIIPANTAHIGQGAFSSCPQLASVSTSAVETGGYAFKNCAKLQTADLGGATAVGASDFADCTALTTVTGAASLTTIGNSAFEGCTALESFEFGRQLRAIGTAAFQHTGLKSADLRQASGLTALGDRAFADNAGLTSVSLPDGVNSIGRGAFFDCRCLESFVLPDGCTTLPDYVFKDAFSLNSLDLGENIGKINAYALKGASGMSYLTLPESVDSIGAHAMEGMDGLVEIDATALSHVPALGEDVWDGVNTADVVLKAPDELIGPFKAAAQWQNFDIKGKSDINGLVEPTTVSLRGRFADELLLIESVGYSLSTVELYDASGLLLTRLSADGADSLCIDTAGMTARLYIVRCVLGDGTTATLKLAR